MLGTSFEDLPYLTFDTTVDVDMPCVPGKLKWNSDDGTVDVCTNINGHTIQIGQEMAPRVVNKSGSTILNGQVVNITGAQGNRIAAGLANAATLATSKVIGVATADIEDNAEGPVALIGKARSIDTTDFSAGDLLFLSATEDGAIVNSPPDAPNRKTFIGIAENSTVNGSIWVTIANGRPIWGLNDVYNNVATATINDTLVNDGTAWANVPATYGQIFYHSDVTTLDIATTTALVNVTGLTDDISNNMTIDGSNGTITVIDTGPYTCTFTMSHQSATPADFDHHIGIDGADQDVCHSNRTIATGTQSGGVPISCMLELTAGEVVTGMVNSVNNETIMYESLNLGCRRIK
jgi:hypothetical protein